MAKRPTVHVGVYIPCDTQLLDTAAVDIMHMASYEYLSPMSELLPSGPIALAPSVQLYWISQTAPGTLVTLTAGAKVAVTHHLSDLAVAPGKLDIVFVPGPDPTLEFGPEITDWLRQQGQAEDTDIICVCTGILLCGAAGLLEGRRASGPRGLQDMIKKKFPNVKLVGQEYRWVQDGNFWSSGTS